MEMEMEMEMESLDVWRGWVVGRVARSNFLYVQRFGFK